MTRVNDCWGVNGCPQITAFCPKASSILPGEYETKNPVSPLQYPGQPLLAELPAIGQVPLVLKTPINIYAWVATDAHRKEH